MWVDCHVPMVVIRICDSSLSCGVFGDFARDDEQPGFSVRIPSSKGIISPFNSRDLLDAYPRDFPVAPRGEYYRKPFLFFQKKNGLASSRRRTGAPFCDATHRGVCGATGKSVYRQIAPGIGGWRCTYDSGRGFTAIALTRPDN